MNKTKKQADAFDNGSILFDIYLCGLNRAMSSGKLLTLGGCAEFSKVPAGVRYNSELKYKGQSNHESLTRFMGLSQDDCCL